MKPLLPYTLGTALAAVGKSVGAVGTDKRSAERIPSDVVYGVEPLSGAPFVMWGK